jgi:thymidylate kinase
MQDVHQAAQWLPSLDVPSAVDRWRRFNDVLMDAARSTDHVHVIDATRSVEEVENDVREWIVAKLQSCS